jgi:hypothetical protein
MRPTVIIDTASGQALIGNTLVPARAAGTHGELQVGDVSGPVLRPLTFSERTRLVTRAAVAPTALDSLCASVLHAATVQPGRHADRMVQEILALTLAGADQDAPVFAETVLRVARATGLELRQLYEAEAAEVDRLAMYLGGPPADAGWTRIVFARGEETLESIRQELGARLLQRADAFAAAITAEPVTAAAPPAFAAEEAGRQVVLERSHLLAQEKTAVQGRWPPAPTVVSPTPAHPLPSRSALRPGHMRIRTPAALLEQRTGTPFAPAASASGSCTAMPVRRWSTRQSRGSPGDVASAAAVRPGSSLSGPSTVATPTIATHAVHPEPLHLVRFAPAEGGQAAPETAAMVPSQQLMGSLTASIAGHSASSPQSTTRPLYTPGQLVLPVAFPCIEPAYNAGAEVAEALAELLEQEADMRGIER